MRSDGAPEGIVGTRHDADGVRRARRRTRAASHPSGVALPTCSVAGQKVDSGSRARCFASYMRIHTLEAS